MVFLMPVTDNFRIAVMVIKIMAILISKPLGQTTNGKILLVHNQYI